MELFQKSKSFLFPQGGKLKIAGSIITMYLLITLVLSFYWSSEPNIFSVQQATQEYLDQNQLQQVVGSTTTATIIFVSQNLANKPGGYLSNDKFPPGLWLDNIPNWEFGALVQIRDISKVMRESFSRSQSQSVEDEDLIVAEPGYNFPNDSWIFPMTESQYKEANTAMTSYLTRLSDPQNRQAQFFARADNLSRWLENVESRLGSLSQRLSSSVGQVRANTDLSGDPSSNQSTPTSTDITVKTPYFEIDDVFYEARGASWALIHLLRAIQMDFAEVLEDKNATASLEQIIRELEATQDFVFSPLILNGSGFGFLANHSLVMASYISRANAGIIDLRSLLSQG